MPDRSVSRFRRLGLGRGAGSQSWVPRTWVGRASALVTRVSRGRRVLSLVISALIVLATGLVTVAVLVLTLKLLRLVRVCRVVVRVGRHGVVPVAMEAVSLQVGGVEGLHFLVGDLDAAWVGGGIEFRLDREPGLGGGRRDGLDHHLVGF